MAWLGGLCIVLAAASSLSAQQVPTSDQSAPRTLVRTDLVLVPVIVTDKTGKPVAGLAKEAFRVEENGKPRNLSLFEERNTQKLAAFSQPSSSTAANYLPYDDHLRLVVVLIDMLNTPWLRQAEGKRQLADYLLHVTNQGEPIALFGLNSNGLRQLHPFTTDTKVLARALQKLKSSLSLEESTQPPTTLTDDPSIDAQASLEEQLISNTLQDLSDTLTADYQRVATRQTLSAIKQFARALGGTPGRKTLIWATAGFPFTIDDPNSFARQGDDLRWEYEQTWRALDAANIAVYPVDLGSADIALNALPSANATVSNTRINSIRGTNGTRSPLDLRYDHGVQQRLTMHAFANATGGRACITISEMEKCFAQAIDDARAYYLLGYDLGGDTEPGWHKLTIKITAKGLHAHFRTGFYVAPELPDTPDLRRQQLVEALASNVQYTGVRLSARLTPEDPSNSPANPQTPAGITQGKLVSFLLGIVADSISVDRDKGNAIDLQIAAVAFDENRRSVASSSQTLATTLKPETFSKALGTALGIPQTLELAPGKYEVKFAVRDNPSGRIGTVSLYLDLK